MSDDIFEPLPNITRKWSKEYDRCVVCESTRYPYIENGLCSRCCHYLEGKKGHERIVVLNKLRPSAAPKQVLSKKRTKDAKEGIPIEVRENLSTSKPWSRKHDRCVRCGDNQTPHMGRGLCLKCYEKESYDRHSGGHDYKPIKEKLTYEYIFEEYVNKKRSLADISKDCRCTRQNIYKKLKLWEIPTRDQSEASNLAHERGKLVFKREDEYGNTIDVVKHKIRVNDKFFSEWSNEMAWVLGLIYTDGNLSGGFIKDTRYKKELLMKRVSLSQKEPEILNKVRNLMDCNAKLLHSRRREYKNTVAGEIYTFTINDEKIYDDLTQLGLMPNKSKIIQFPVIDDQYMRHFIRGCWDGDGSVFLQPAYGYTRPKIRASFTSGSKSFIESMAQALEKAGLPKRNIRRDRESYEIRYGDNQCKLLYHYLYHDVSSGQYLERKYKVFEDYFGRLSELKGLLPED